MVAPDKRWTDLDHGHELYCAGHLVQAAMAYHRATGHTRLLSVATRFFADHIALVFGTPRNRDDVVQVDLPMTPRLIEAYPQIDATRGSVAIERGPMVCPWKPVCETCF